MASSGAKEQAIAVSVYCPLILNVWKCIRRRRRKTLHCIDLSYRPKVYDMVCLETRRHVSVARFFRNRYIKRIARANFFMVKIGKSLKNSFTVQNIFYRTWNPYHICKLPQDSLHAPPEELQCQVCVQKAAIFCNGFPRLPCCWWWWCCWWENVPRLLNEKWYNARIIVVNFSEFLGK